MLDWCLRNSLQSGSFKVSELDETLGDAYYYGVSFLTDAGYFDKRNRFWINQDFPEAPRSTRIEMRLQSIASNDPGMKEAREILQAVDPVPPPLK
jgi:hypothetical protein